MGSFLSNPEFYHELETCLAMSNGEQRRMWASTIIREDLEIKDLSKLLEGERKTAIRFLWLLSDIGIAAPGKLLRELPFLFEACEHLNPEYKASFASFWLYAGVPVEDEGKAIDWLFHLLLSHETTVTIKSRAAFVLARLTRKYPELKHELRTCLEKQMNKYSADFEKRAVKIVTEITTE